MPRTRIIGEAGFDAQLQATLIVLQGAPKELDELGRVFENPTFWRAHNLELPKRPPSPIKTTPLALYVAARDIVHFLIAMRRQGILLADLQVDLENLTPKAVDAHNFTRRLLRTLEGVADQSILEESTTSIFPAFYGISVETDVRFVTRDLSFIDSESAPEVLGWLPVGLIRISTDEDDILSFQADESDLDNLIEQLMHAKQKLRRARETLSQSGQVMLHLNPRIIDEEA